MTAPITYLFDPFCGWCYGAAPQVARLRAALGNETVQGLPVGLFFGDGKTPMTPQFRDHAWSNDLRIAQLTSQPFSRDYYDKVLSNFDVPFDSAPPTRAFAIAEMIRLGGGLDMLARMQEARFVEGRNLFDAATLIDIAAELGFDRRGFAEAFDGPDGAAALEIMVDNGQAMMRRLKLRGVPALALRHGDHYHPVAGDGLIDPDAGLVESLVERFGAPDAEAAHEGH